MPLEPVVSRSIRKILIANRGEIACRIMRTCRAMGIATVAVFSDADANARHVREADEAVRIVGSAPAESYLNIGAMLRAIVRGGADAVHPGYGFLAEDAAFAREFLDDALNITFIGPHPDTIAQMGNKREARRLVAAAGVPVLPGYDGGDQSDERLAAAARELGYPVMVKASLGCGFKGMRVVTTPRALPAALTAARREARAAFGDETLLLERALAEPRHIEFQIFGDTHGHLIHLGERECTIQRRHQKVIEEAPSPALTPNLRARMAEAALTVGRLLGYTNAGTVEFILDVDGAFYFLEVNTRLQVEHPITELVTGLDLVRWQILVAEGHPLPLTQDRITFSGHAIEARVYAEDPARGFLPAAGPVALWREPAGEGVRVDAGIATGDSVSPHYDPLLAKVSAWGGDRAEALRRLDRALGATTLFGLRNNLAFLRRVLLHPAHIAGELSTSFIERHSADLLAGPLAAQPVDGDPAHAALAVAVHRALTRPVAPEARGWRNNPGPPITDRFIPLITESHMPPDAPGDDDRKDGRAIEVRLTPMPPMPGERFSATVAAGGAERTFPVSVHQHAGPDLALELDGWLVRCVVARVGEREWWAKAGEVTTSLLWRSPLPEPDERGPREGSLSAPMPGQVVALLVAEGQVVQAGEPLLILHAMKMEHVIAAPYAGTVAAVHCHAGDSVPASAALLELVPTQAR